MLIHIVDFFIDYFTHLSIKKSAGGGLFVLGLFLIGTAVTSNSIGRGALQVLAGFIISSAGAIIIRYDMANDTIARPYNELETLSHIDEHSRRNKT